MKPETPSHYIPRFSWKSSLLLFLAIIVGGILLPYLFYLIGLNLKLAVMLFLPLLVALAVTYGQYFIETNRGFNKQFVISLVAMTLVLEIASYLWLFVGVIF
ncbi:hypothetical protein [Vagococcus zengguangii]|uniref:Uncharacterized protein n=1 Tax=Vagococcus zengguangii TaxID=2571750 RepID=A0A4D7CSH7_9ENTE|nr:hypothetical protein [Vagococcus zengguangii]QCI85844.1 hypothetical protein FA707_02175 [Vagococcus zengguangii]TLG81784.1 hypothetical protein FE258_01155 [Vagococcus zengguangii]